MSKDNEIELFDNMAADARVSLGIVHGSRLAMEQPGACNPETVAPALAYVEEALGRVIQGIRQLDDMRAERSAAALTPAHSQE